MQQQKRSGWRTVADIAQLAIATARAAAGDLTGLAYQGLKWFKVVLGIVFSLILVLVLLMSLPLLRIQALTPSGTQSAALLAYAEEELAQLTVNRDAAHSEAKSWLETSIWDFLNGGDNRGVSQSQDLHVNAQEVLILYAVKYGGNGVNEKIERARIAEIAHLFVERSKRITTDEEGYLTLHISALTKTFATVMDDLGFDATQKAIAQNMFEVLHFNQNLTQATGNSPQGVEIGDLVFTDGQIPVVYLNQCDNRWNREPYGKTGTVGRSACGPTALAMAVCSLTTFQYNPAEMARWAYINGYRAEGNGSYHSLFYEGAKSFGLKVESVGRDEGDKIRQALKDGKLVVAIMTKGHFTSGGHFIMLRGITEDGQILVADPASLSRSQKTWELSLIQNETSPNTSTPFWILSK